MWKEFRVCFSFALLYSIIFASNSDWSSLLLTSVVLISVNCFIYLFIYLFMYFIIIILFFLFFRHSTEKPSKCVNESVVIVFNVKHSSYMWKTRLKVFFRHSFIYSSNTMTKKDYAQIPYHISFFYVSKGLHFQVNHNLCWARLAFVYKIRQSSVNVFHLSEAIILEYKSQN